MSNHQLSITAGQVGKFIQSMAEVGSENFQRQGVPLLHLLAEYLRQEKPRIPSLTAMRMVLGLPARPDLGVANVEWAKAVPPQRLSEFAVRPGGRKRAWTQVARLFPEDLGLVSGDVVPSQVLERALEWGFQLIPPEAFVVLTRNVFGGQVVPGDAMAYLDENTRELIIEGPPGTMAELEKRLESGGSNSWR